MTKPLSQLQLDRNELMRARVLARLEQLANDARADQSNIIGRRARRSDDVKRLQRRVRAVTERWAPRWTTAAAAEPDAVVHLEHVVPVIVLAERILQGDEVPAVLAQAVTCWVTYDEHKTVLPVAFRLRTPELYEQMLTSPLSELAALGWQRYDLAGVSAWSPLT